MEETNPRPPRLAALHGAPPWVFLILALGALLGVLLGVDLAPRVGSDFFFATDDPQLARSLEIERLFPSQPQVLIHAAAEDRPGFLDPQYREEIGELTARLEALPGVASVYSLATGPPHPDPERVASSPLWSRLLLPPDGRSSNLILSMAEDGAATMAAVEAVVAGMEPAGLTLRISGVPYVVEQIRRQLLRDLRVFSLAALLLFGVAVAVVFRSWKVVVGTLASCVLACCITLLALDLQGVPIGLLTANIATIVFVLTLSHIVFLTASWQRQGGTGGDASDRAVTETLPASFWCAVTTLLGFGSLLFASARPMRELGNAGVVGTLAALVVAYAAYPAFLRWAGSAAGATRPLVGGTFWDRRLMGGVVAAGVLVAVSALGVPLLETDPSLLAYFQPGGELRRGLEAVDTAGGSSPLSLVVGVPGGGSLLEAGPQDHLAALQRALEADPAVGTAVSLPVLLAEGRTSLVGRFLPAAALVTLLDSDAYGNIGRSFVTEDRQRALFFLRMREGGRTEGRREVVQRLTGQVEAAGLEAHLVGGLYDLQGQLSRLVSRSLLKGLLALLALFGVIAAIVARRLSTALAMLAVLVALPVLILGLLGHLRLPLDIIASPAVNVALALGVDSMIHLVTARRRLATAGGLAPWAAWVAARRQLARPVVGAAAILAAGFGIFALSSFPPTRNFGLAVVAGTTAAAFLALVVLPWLAGGRRLTDGR
jgi:predicted RND superfamily exporter protein